MSKPQVRIFGSTVGPVFRLSPLYAAPGWYSVAEPDVSIGPYAKAEHAIEKARELQAERGTAIADV